MKAPRIPLALIAAVAIALATATLADPASADHGRRGKARGHWKARYKPAECVVVQPRPTRVVYAQPRVYRTYATPSFANLVLAGVIGGVQVSAQFGDSPYQGYGYWDPYCDVRFNSMSAYRHHCGVHHHPYQLRVFAVAPGHSCDRWCDHDCDDEFDRTWDRDDGYDDDRYDDRYDDDDGWDR